MEAGQLAAFAPMAIFCCIFLVLIIGFIVLVVFLLKKTKESEWTGEVIDKKYNQTRDFDTDRLEDHYVLVVKTSGGHTKNLGVSRKMYDECKVGDKLKKERGKMLPEKV